MEYWFQGLVKVPKLGFGTYNLKGQNGANSVKVALKRGLRLIDTAQIYDNEREVGQGIKESKVPRADIFLTTKIWFDQLTEEKIKQSFQESLNKLQTDYVDLLLIHWPNFEVPLEESLGAFMSLQTTGQVRHIGVSNFTCSLLSQAIQICPQIITNQLEYHPLLTQRKMLDFIEGKNIFLTAYSPLLRGKVFKIQQLIDLAEKYNKSSAQIALKWLVEQKNVVAIFKSAHEKSIEENCNIFDFHLEARDKEILFRLSKNKQRLVNPPFAPKWDE